MKQILAQTVRKIVCELKMRKILYFFELAVEELKHRLDLRKIGSCKFLKFGSTK